MWEKHLSSLHSQKNAVEVNILYAVLCTSVVSVSLILILNHFSYFEFLLNYNVLKTFCVPCVVCGLVLGHIYAAEGKGLVPLNSPLGRRAAWTLILGRKENYLLLVLVKRKTHSEHLQQSDCSSSTQLLMLSNMKSRINKNVFLVI